MIDHAAEVDYNGPAAKESLGKRLLAWALGERGIR